MNAVVYTSNSGFTAEYAEMLGEKLCLPVYSLKDARNKLSRGDEIIYFGWLMAGKVMGYKKASGIYRIGFVCGVGMGACGSQLDDVRKTSAVPENIALFTLQGGFDLNKLHGIYKLMMSAMKNTVGKKLAAKPDKSAEEADMLGLLQNGGSRVCEENLLPVIGWYEQHNKEA